ncbi:DUF3108 domain-containing protein [Candidatus Thioglobus sp.]|uniref:DUF3108 domain-containing protein n=1 Tax=Candidatus Thioglobus sp. TaxID=2026721 RepID=UPI003D111049
MKLLFILLTLISATSLAFEAHVANYQLSIGGFKIAEEVRTLKPLEGSYFYTANAKTSGLAALIKDYSIAAESTFSINNAGVDSSTYQIIEREDKEISKNRSINIDSNLQVVTSALNTAQPKINNWKVNQGNIVDPLSLFLALSFDLKNKPDQSLFSYQVADGKSIKRYDFKKSGNQRIHLENKDYNAIKIKRINHKSGQIEAYFLPAYQYLPALIKQTKKGRNYTYKMTTLNISTAKGLQVVF